MSDNNIFPVPKGQDGEVQTLESVTAGYFPHPPRNGRWHFYPRLNGHRAMEPATGLEYLVLKGRVFAKSADFTVGVNEDLFAVDASGADRVGTLQAAATYANGKRFVFVKTDSSTNTVRVTTTGGETINGLTDIRLTHQYEALTVETSGAAWYIVSHFFPRAIFRSGSDLASKATTAVVTEENLNTVTLPKNFLDANEKGVRIKAWGTVADNNNVKTVRSYFGATVLSSNDITARPRNQAWTLDAVVYRTGSNAQEALGEGTFGAVSQSVTRTTPAETDTGDIVVKITGQNGTASANDIVCKGLVVEAIQ